MPAILDVSCPLSLNAASMTEISVAVVSKPVKAAQSVVIRCQRPSNAAYKSRTVDDHACADHVRASIHCTGLSDDSWWSARERHGKERKTNDEGYL